MPDMDKVFKELKEHFEKLITSIAEVIVGTVVEGEFHGFKQTSKNEFDLALQRLGRGASVMNLLQSGKNETAWNKVKSEYCSAVHKARVAANHALDEQVGKARAMIDEICEESTHEVDNLKSLLK
ncbi:hypothetical protein HHI36_018772 [Cryptolaemus montrouzieri]|uniref:Uncharacterized protein n=1 Tax=Cryptolaemus montrouzieri TaxID=559131 RepID=A0ABD2P1L0_9CUCU